MFKRWKTEDRMSKEHEKKTMVALSIYDDARGLKRP